MRTTNTFRTAIEALRTNLGRSLLTILGIVIGIVAIVLVISLGQGAQRLILNEIESIGANTIIIRPGREPEGPTDIAESVLSDSIKAEDIEALMQPFNVPGAASVDPAVLISGEATYQDNIYRPLMFGWTPDAIVDLFQISPAEGTLFTQDDIKQRARVAVIGSKVKEELFGQSDALGSFIKVKGHNLRVIGVFASKGQVLSFNVDDVVLIPYSTAQRTILGIDYFHEVFIQAAPNTDVETVAADIRATLREQHGITNPDKDDFFVLTQENIADTLSIVTNVLTVFLVAVASISLVVGGIGIMNIMLVSVTERTHEIGLRKAVGATSRNILKQFLTEAIILTVSGGLIGTTIALLLSTLVAIVARQQYNINWPFTLPMSAIALGVGTAAVIGIVFGLYPARKAAQKDPIEALRYE